MNKYSQEQVEGLEEQIKKRLTEIKIQNKDAVQKRLDRFKEFYKQFSDDAGIKLFDVDASLPLQNIVENITFGLENQA